MAPAPLRIVFMGTAALAATVLETLAKSGQGSATESSGSESLAAEPSAGKGSPPRSSPVDWSIVAVVSQPDKPKGRDLKLQPTPVKEAASRLGLTVLQPVKARDPAFIDELRGLAPDLIVVAAYGQILPQALLDIPRFGCLNVHTSILPRYRGAAPIQWAILNGDAETGVTIMKMDAGLDTGPVLAEERTAIAPEDDAQTLHDRLALLGGALLVKTIPGFVRGEIVPRPQPAEGATYARKITKEDGKLDWHQPAEVLWNKVRGLRPWPGTFTSLQRDPAPLLLKIWHAEPVAGTVPAEPGTVLASDRHGIVVACGVGALRITELQREGGKRLTAQQFLAGTPIAARERVM